MPLLLCSNLYRHLENNSWIILWTLHSLWFIFKVHKSTRIKAFFSLYSVSILPSSTFEVKYQAYARIKIIFQRNCEIQRSHLQRCYDQLNSESINCSEKFGNERECYFEFTIISCFYLNDLKSEVRKHWNLRRTFKHVQNFIQLTSKKINIRNVSFKIKFLFNSQLCQHNKNGKKSPFSRNFYLSHKSCLI